MVSVAELVQNVSNTLIAQKDRQVFKHIRKPFFMYEVQCALINVNLYTCTVIPKKFISLILKQNSYLSGLYEICIQIFLFCNLLINAVISL